jgi:maleylacetate reductase
MTGPASFTHDQRQVRVVFGTGQISSLGDEIDRLDLRRVQLIATRYAPVARQHLADRVVDEVLDPRPHVPMEQVGLAVDAGVRAGIDAVVAVGGGSSIGLAKMVARETGVPVVAVPTTYSGSEMTRMWGRTEGGRKQTGRDVRVGPRTVIYDPDLLVPLPPAVGVASAVNAVAHAVEALYAPDRSVFSDLVATEAVRSIMSGVASGHDVSQVLRGSCLAGSVLDTTTMGLHHKICHTLGGALDLPHAPAHSVVLPHVLALNLAVPEVAATFAEVMPGVDLPSRIRETCLAAGVPVALRDLGMARSAIAEMTRTVIAAAPANPYPLDERVVREVIERAWAGDGADGPSAGGSL